MTHQRLYINIDHVATVRQARRGDEPVPVQAVAICERAGADGITAHLREDRRHIQDADIDAIAAAVTTAFNLEIACTAEMLALAERLRPHQVTLVPERREEVTTEGGLDVNSQKDAVGKIVKNLKDGDIIVSLFIDPDVDQVKASHKVSADRIELHTGRYCEARSEKDRQREFNRIVDAAKASSKLGLGCAAGHGLNYDNVRPIAKIAEIDELNIGHAIVARAVLVGFDRAVSEMVEILRNP
jgi:pyridoxine 5-phosphate synthase